MAVGGIVSHGDINTIVAAGRADMCALGRGFLEDAYFARHAARELNYSASNGRANIAARRSAVAGGVEGDASRHKLC